MQIISLLQHRCYAAAKAYWKRHQRVVSPSPAKGLVRSSNKLPLWSHCGQLLRYAAAISSSNLGLALVQWSSPERIPRNVETSTLHLDALRDLKSVNANLVAVAAYPVLERNGDLLPTHIREPSAT